MALTEETVRARIDAKTKKRAMSALNEMGLSVSTAIRLFLDCVSRTGELPFPIETPNATTRKALRELQAGKGKRHGSAAELYQDLGI